MEAELRRMQRFMLGAGVAGASVLMLWKGPSWSAGWMIGAAISWVNFGWLKKVVGALGGEGQSQPKKRYAVILGLRYGLFGVAAYLAVRYVQVNLYALLCGLFLAVAAVIAEILYQLIVVRSDGSA